MNKPYKTLLGNRIYVEIPKINESSLILSEEAKRTLTTAEISKLDRLTVYDIGDTVTTVKVGDVILVDRSEVARAPIVTLSSELSVLLISPFQVIHIW